VRSLRGIAARIGEIAPHIVHLQYQTAAFDMSPAVSLLPFLVRATAGRPRFVTTFHDLRVPYLFPRAGGLRRVPGRLLLGASDGAIFTSPADLIASRRRGNAAWIPIGPGIVPAGRPRRVAARDQFHIDANAFVIAYFGFMNSSKGVNTLLEAGAQLVRTGLDFRFLFIGENEGASDPTNVATTARLRALASQVGLEARIVRTGWLSPPGITRALAAADVAALPYADGASLRRSTLVTCFAHGIPVVTTTPAAQPPVSPQHLVEPFDHPEQLRIDQDVAALVPPGDDRALADALWQLAENPDRRTALASAGRQMAKRLGWPGIAHATASFYDRTLGMAA
jgi:glycosyltransferase involved in cell wall biosynthesis